MRFFFLLLTVALFLTSITGDDAERMLGMKEGGYVREDCGSDCMPCGGECCCEPNSCIDGTCHHESSPN
uniref:Conotoxin phi-MiXXVIIA n=2 Tax=Conus TaxID=6490 RepID=CG2RA_CONMI|nr:RecName: Full=Conotoxin phi-MiXXVIIA; AltName: Full=Conopeptide Mi045; Flags: Precursor [Conus miles]AKB91383.1 conopeptide Mi045 [Conus miles]